uniref:Uncharacterized protein n=1 Tax=Plectus sambesii TaxID=2011161 RepID=A0A914X8E5_9BILA
MAGAFFSSLLGSTSLTSPMISATHISNASDGPIWAKCDTDDAKITADSSVLEGLSFESRTEERLADRDFKKICRGDYEKFVPSAPAWDRFCRDTFVYILVFHVDKE